MGQIKNIKLHIVTDIKEVIRLSKMSNPRVCYEFKVEKIIGISSEGTYQVQWAPAWVSKFHLVGCEHLIQEFLSQQQCDLIESYAEQVESQNQSELSSAEAEKSHWEKYDEVTLNESNDQLTMELEVKQEPSDADNEACIMIEHLPVSKEFDFEDAASSKKIQQYNIPIDESIVSSSKLIESSIEEQSANRQDDDRPEPYASSPEHRPFHNTIPFEKGRKNRTDKRYECELCSKSFPSLSKLSNHSNKVHTGEAAFKCAHCEFTSSSKSTFTVHLRTHRTLEKQYKCDECGSSFAQRGNLVQHKRIHSGEQPYECENCGQRFTFSNQRKRHMSRGCNA